MKSIFILLMLLISAQALSQTDKQYPKSADRKTFYQALSANYNSSAIREIFNSDSENLFDNYVDGHSELELVNSFSTVIHELLHSFNSSENGGYYYFIEPGIRCFVKEGKYYNSKELNNYVRKGLQDSIFRYPLYIGATQAIPGHAGRNHKGEFEEEGFSVARGIYGLLDEFSAYYYGALTTKQLYTWYLSGPEQTLSNRLKDYKHELLSDISAYYEFKLFFGWYLLFAKEKHPDVYNDILSNKPLRVVFTLIEEKFHKLADEVALQMVSVNEKMEPDLMEILDFSGSDEDIFRFIEMAGLAPSMIYKEESAIVNGRTVKVKKCIMSKEDFAQMKAGYLEMMTQLNAASDDSMMLFFAQPNRSIVYLEKQLTPEISIELEKLKIAGLTTLNYEQFLK